MKYLKNVFAVSITIAILSLFGITFSSADSIVIPISFFVLFISGGLAVTSGGVLLAIFVGNQNNHSE